MVEFSQLIEAEESVEAKNVQQLERQLEIAQRFFNFFIVGRGRSYDIQGDHLSRQRPCATVTNSMPTGSESLAFGGPHRFLFFA